MTVDVGGSIKCIHAPLSYSFSWLVVERERCHRICRTDRPTEFIEGKHSLLAVNRAKTRLKASTSQLRPTTGSLQQT